MTTADNGFDVEATDADAERSPQLDVPDVAQPAEGVAQPGMSEGPAPTALELEPTGEPRVDAAVQALAALDDLPTAEHADVYEDVHRRLHAALTELDSE
jgi:hypothetical protein